MRTLARRLGAALLAPGALTGALLGALLFAAQPGGSGRAGLVVGWLYGVVVGALVRRFPVPRGAYFLAGMLVGPLPIALLLPSTAPNEDRGLVWVGVVAGLFIGLVEGLSARRAERAAAGAEGR
jgi:hypothetical protein